MTELQVLQNVLESEQNDARTSQWEHSPFKAMVPQVSIKKIGSIFERFVIALCSQYGIDHERPQSTDYDIVIQGKRIEVKGATLSRSGTFIANQIRPTQNYDYVLIICLSPNTVHYHLYSKAEAILAAKPQHSGHKGRETLQLTLRHDDNYNRSDSFLGALQGIIT